MFTQFRNVVGQLAQETTRALENAALAESQTEVHSRSQSLDTQPSASAPSSSQLADSALSSLRKSLAAQRAGTSSPTPRRSASPAPTEKRLPKSNLEERLRRATTGIAEPSGSSTPNRSPPNRSSTASPSPIPKNVVNRHKKSPSSTPLPASPAVIAVTEDDSKLTPPTELSLQDPPVTSEVQPPKEEEKNNNPDPSPLAEDSVPVPVEDTPPKDKEDGVKMREAPVSSPKTVSAVDHSAEVESLQQRLRQVEQRFSDVSTSFKRLQAEKLAADAVLREISPLESIQNTTALRNFFTNLKTKDQVILENTLIVNLLMDFLILGLRRRTQAFE
ncbi:hypothetical protein BYT27DRAFT_7098535 [Phlegmacium glaucopus]|nr:hypothetical protein BYT27DRAFT_7098535 [Phlegmacium glaucopus]